MSAVGEETNHNRCKFKATYPGAGVDDSQCVYVAGVGFQLPELGERVAAFRWPLCSRHSIQLREELQDAIRADIAALAARMGLEPGEIWSSPVQRSCPECGAGPDDVHDEWCPARPHSS